MASLSGFGPKRKKKRLLSAPRGLEKLKLLTELLGIVKKGGYRTYSNRRKDILKLVNGSDKLWVVDALPVDKTISFSYPSIDSLKQGSMGRQTSSPATF